MTSSRYRAADSFGIDCLLGFADPPSAASTVSMSTRPHRHKHLSPASQHLKPSSSCDDFMVTNILPTSWQYLSVEHLKDCNATVSQRQQQHQRDLNSSLPRRVTSPKTFYSNCTTSPASAANASLSGTWHMSNSLERPPKFDFPATITSWPTAQQLLSSHVCGDLHSVAGNADLGMENIFGRWHDLCLVKAQTRAPQEQGN